MQEKPNILMICADQMTPFLLDAYGGHNVLTPNINRLFAEGVTFETAYTPNPLCAPARASFVTGKYSSEIDAWDNAAPFGCDIPTFGHYLTLAGYETALDGKLHFVGPDQLHGFEKRLVTDIFPSDYTMLFGDARVTIEKNHAKSYTQTGVTPWNDNFEYDEEVHHRAMQFLAKRNTASRPYFLCVSYQQPHQPFFVPQELWDIYEDTTFEIPELPENFAELYNQMDRDVNRFHGVESYRDAFMQEENLQNLYRAYAAMYTYIDRKVGQLIELLKVTGQLENTVILFTSDHGDMMGQRGMIQKRSFGEWSSRIPLAIRFPNQEYAGSTVNQPVSLIDIAPTFLDIAGVDREHSMSGYSLLETMRGNIPQDRSVFCEEHVEGVTTPCFMIRKEQWKYIYMHEVGETLYDLSQDPFEWDDLSQQPDQVDRVRSLKDEILCRFDPDQIESKVLSSLKRRQLLKEAMLNTDTFWDYQPALPVSEMYMRRRPMK